MIEVVETKGQALDLKKEMIEMIEVVETKGQALDLKKEVDFRGEDKTQETSFH
jgi:hypothetical protein